MAAGLSVPDATRPDRAPTRVRGEPARRVLLGTALALLLLVGLTGPNAATPDLAPRGWAPGTLVPLSLGPAAVTAVLWAGYLCGAAALLLAVRLGPAPLRSWRGPAALGVATLLTHPFGSADHVSYLAYGRILVTGGDPWLVSPEDWGGGTDPVTSRVEPPWTEEPSVYGPAATLVLGLAARVGGENLRVGVWVWQVVLVLAWLAVRWALRRLLPEDAHGRVDTFWTLNPLLVGVVLLGAHVDLLCAALVVLAVLVAARRAGPAGALAAGVLLGLAASSKVTYAIGLLALGVGWWLAAGRARAVVNGAAALAGALLVALPLHAWAGPHVYDQLGRSRRAVSLATPWRAVLESGATLGPVGTRDLVALGSAVLAVALALALTLRVRPAGRRDLGTVALRVLAVLFLAYSLAASYTLPWYDAMVWAALPAVAAGPVDAVAALRGLVGALAYVPGRVLGSTPDVEAVTLGVRGSLAPVLVGMLWVAVLVIAAGRVGSVPRTGPRAAPPTG